MRANKLIVAVTGLHVLAHSVFGCCVHFFSDSEPTKTEASCSHSSNRLSEATPQHQTPHVDGNDCSNIEHAAPSVLADDGSAPKHKHACRHVNCHWKTCEPCPDIKLLASSSIEPFVHAIIATNDLSGSSGLSSFEIDVGRFPALSLRLHLVHGVLQI
jgi:hypothetical protein